MKNEGIFRLIKFCLIVSIAGVFFIGCARTLQREIDAWTYQGYPGPALPREQVARVYCSQQSCVVSDIDGRPLDYHYPGFSPGHGPKYPKAVLLLPGKHAITFLPAGAMYGDAIHKVIDLEAGRNYIVALALLNAQRVRSWNSSYTIYRGQPQLTIRTNDVSKSLGVRSNKVQSP
jgi:hypothetical protein